MDQFTFQDPRTQYPTPDAQGPQQQSAPGSTKGMRPEPDHGEETYRGTDRLRGRKALITGADSGIGRAVAIAFAREGADVVISYLQEDADAAATAALVEQAGRKAVMVRGDVRDEAHCAELVERTVGELGGIDILVNNAAYQMSGKGVAELSTEQMDRVFKTNLYALFWLCRAAVPHMPPGSTIVNSTSIQAREPSPELMDYAATKAAILNATQSLSGDLISRGIRVNAVAPGPVWTPLIPSTMPEEKVAEFGKQTPMGRAAQPAELAPAYVFLASPESGYITGETLAVTGGRFLT
ncbi:MULTISPECIES: SDR family oxidoreductase [Actinokineospora]|uniref:NAD(P)-dependent oxidoreductase n=1 Tax=Actinokineospora fastidiosa TaxID=1816 RepID=A0A918GD90_9PSEU|nr:MULTISPECIES: SDR family oxidoreductase [Actinokineospora]UVS79779.1 General stress protein 39 [Actinokineospora sp. UTMC 2448]GGS30875.1 NAD(P)-dependent oxidoreductase [Actinokineospora fastidiosa]